MRLAEHHGGAGLKLAGLPSPGAGRRILAERFSGWHRWEEQVISMEQTHR
jgi:GDPmannose 4,6-dehydratase